MIYRLSFAQAQIYVDITLRFVHSASMNETNTTESFQARCERECREVALANIDAAQRSERLYGIFLAVAFVAAAVLIAIAAL